jgi:hypothetical protein
MENIANMAAYRKSNHGRKLKPFTGLEALRYWLLWALLIAALAYGVHRYFEYRNTELDKRLEQLQ